MNWAEKVKRAIVHGQSPVVVEFRNQPQAVKDKCAQRIKLPKNIIGILPEETRHFLDLLSFIYPFLIKDLMSFIPFSCQFEYDVEIEKTGMLMKQLHGG